MKKAINLFIILFCIAAGVLLYQYVCKTINENRALKKIILRLEADSRIAEVLVTDTRYDSNIQRPRTTIKFLEYDVDGKPLQPKYFTFSGNIIQFQSLVIRFDDMYVRKGDRLRGRSAYLFWKVFMLDGRDTQEYEITKLYGVPEGYKIDGSGSNFEARLWRKFWEYALNQDKAKAVGIKNLQLEAPGTKFIPGTLYTIKIEHDGGMRIDAETLPEILKGERIPG